METRILPEGMALAKLPFFELKEKDRLVLVDDTVGPIIDAHTHLAGAYVLPLRFPLNVAEGPTEHYLPMRGRRIDLDIYMNKNFTRDDLRRMKRDLAWKSLSRSGMRRTHTIPNLVREMADLGITQSISLPIDLPVLSNNAETTLKALRGDDAFIAFGSVHPYARNVKAKLDRQVALGARGIKVHPAVQAIYPDDRRAMRLYRLCGQRKLPVLWHCGPVGIEPVMGRKRSQVMYYERAIAENPDTVFLLGHSGALQMEMALGYANRYPNVYLELASQSLRNIRKILEGAPRDRVIFGTDWPFYHQAVGIAKVIVAAGEDTETRRMVLHDNAARLFLSGR